ncbi:hypothetical protein M3666_03110 [Curtobacterium sp. ODYSSEY 48 V2]|uniref:hypothetical protein n=1 Tax=Curtobacterium sp. ODYSSEY 48 V2 TaxID=2939561 RepID=UPI00203C6D42|nr:hypothetical protein [Curtobacterium sp. ODYSSEY 48 V2]MCM3504104.1 hypothetical protein [Curtobacterium sp. ODYSSEY 48 V2]
MSYPAYEETVRSGRVMTVVGWAVIATAVGIATLVLAVPAGWQDQPPSASDVGVLVVTLAVTVALGIGMMTMRMTVRVDEVLEVRVRPWWYRRRVAPEQITSAEVVHMTGGNSGGLGIRLVPGGTAVLLDGGPGVQVAIRGARSLRFRCNDPEAVVAALRARGASAD